MSNIKTIEQLDETSASELTDNDLLMTSVRNINGNYTSKKMTLSALADYVNSRESGGGSGFGGYEMIDTSESGNGIYDASTIQSYVSDPSKNYLWGLSIGNATGTVNHFEKTVHKDCVVWFSGIGTNLGNVYLGEEGRDDEIQLNMKCLQIDSSALCRFYIKSEQKLRIEPNASGNVHVSILPLLSGGEFFFDTSKPDKFYTGVIGPINSPQTAYEGSDKYTGDTFTAECTTLFAYTYGTQSVMSSQSSTQNKINDKNIYVPGNSENASNIKYIILKSGDVFKPYTTNPMQDNIQIDWIAYPLLVG